MKIERTYNQLWLVTEKGKYNIAELLMKLVEPVRVETTQTDVAKLISVEPEPEE